MKRLLIAFLLLAPAAFISGAQEKPDERALVLRGVTENIPLADMVQMTAEYNGLTFVYSSRTLAGEASVMTPREGVTIGPAKMLEMLQDMLAQSRFAAVKNGETWSIGPMVETCTYAQIVTEEELDGIDPGLYVGVVMQLHNLDSNVVTSNLRNLTSRQGGMVQPIAGPESFVVIADRAGRVKELAKYVRDLDNSMATTTRKHLLPPGADAVRWQSAVQQLLAGNPQHGWGIAATPDGKSLLVRGTEDIHNEVKQAIESLK